LQPPGSEKDASSKCCSSPRTGKERIVSDPSVPPLHPSATYRSIARRLAAAALVATVVCGAADRGNAAEVRILSAAAMQTVFKTIGDEFERTSGHKLVFAYATMGAITNRIMAGETADLVVGSTQSMEQLAKAGKIDAARRVTIAKVGIGAVVATGTPKPRL
jgi:molybdate transport system substrate-binding protein